MTTQIKLTDASLALFKSYANDAGNWSGTPMVGGNVGGSQADVGNLTDLKKNGLLTTFASDGEKWVSFTEAGVTFAAEHGIKINL